MSSVAIRLSRSAKVIDVTTLLRHTIQLPDQQQQQQQQNQNDDNALTLPHDNNPDCLVLVGTIYTLHKGFIQYQHTLQPPSPDTADGTSEEPQVYDEPYHIVYTLSPDESPLLAYEKMERYLIDFLDHYHQIFANSTLIRDVTDSQTDQTVPPSTIAPKIQWYYIPTLTINLDSNVGTLIPNCVELDGYCTYMEDDVDILVAVDGNFDTDDPTEESIGEMMSQAHIERSTDVVPSSLLLSNDEYGPSHKMCSVFPWLSKLDDQQSNPSPETSSSDCHGTTTTAEPASSALCSATAVSRPYSRKVQRALQYEERLYNEFCFAESQTPPHACITGYLLYRNTQQDIHAWTRMYCRLTNHDLWFVSRIYTCLDTHHTNGSSSSSSNNNDVAAPPVANQTYRYVRHRRIRLTRAILIQPTPTSEPSLFRIPYSFEIVASDGTSHVFRTGSKYQHTVWMSSISERIITSYESSLFDNAQLIMAEECYARNRRATTVAVEPLWDQTIRVMMDGNQHPLPGSDPQSHHHQQQRQQQQPSIGNSIGSVLRFGMDVSTYKDRCRFVRSTMPTRTPIVVAASVATPTQLLRRRFFSSSSSTGSLQQSRESSTPDALKYEPYASHIQSMIRITWDQAAALLGRARNLALTLHVRSSIMHRHDKNTEQQHHPTNTVTETLYIHGSSDRPIRLSHGIETLYRHIDFVLTGRLDVISNTSSSSSSSSSHILTVDQGTLATAATTNMNLQRQQEEGPPPDDLFDHLLTELQSLAASADYYHINHQKRDCGVVGGTPLYPSNRQ